MSLNPLDFISAQTPEDKAPIGAVWWLGNNPARVTSVKTGRYDGEEGEGWLTLNFTGKISDRIFVSGIGVGVDGFYSSDQYVGELKGAGGSVSIQAAKIESGTTSDFSSVFDLPEKLRSRLPEVAIYEWREYPVWRSGSLSMGEVLARVDSGDIQQKIVEAIAAIGQDLTSEMAAAAYERMQAAAASGNANAQKDAEKSFNSLGKFLKTASTTDIQKRLVEEGAAVATVEKYVLANKLQQCCAIEAQIGCQPWLLTHPFRYFPSNAWGEMTIAIANYLEALGQQAIAEQASESDSESVKKSRGKVGAAHTPQAIANAPSSEVVPSSGSNTDLVQSIA